MEIEEVRKYSLGLPHTTETVQWGNDLVFKIGGKMYAVISLEPSQHWMSFKCSPERFAELIERQGIDPAPYLAKSQWVALKDKTVMNKTEIKQSILQAYEIVFSKLPKKLQSNLKS
jgi:predicted DNA-binding protein (MmcQ/YjbR family)